MRFLLYEHNGAANHGCEAIVRGTLQINSGFRTMLFTSALEEDLSYHIENLCEVKKKGEILKRFSIEHFYLKIKSILKKSNQCFCEYAYKNLFDNLDKDDIAFAIGGDIYCYKGTPTGLSYLNKAINEHNVKTVLWGCSIEPELLKQEAVVQDLKRYALITPRETITYNALIEAGIEKNTKLYPDPAFTLETVNLALPKGFVEQNTIGINVSPLIIGCEVNKGSTMENYIALLQHIIDTTDMQIALIPHVVWNDNDDRKPLRQLYKIFAHTERIVMIEDHNCMELKGYIARCRMFIGARTHATIAAYSSNIPTLVVGYSVKAKGIAKDIFDTYENYVIPVQSLSNKDDLINAFEWMKEHEKEIRFHLQEFMPAYIKKSWQAGEEVKSLIKTQSYNND